MVSEAELDRRTRAALDALQSGVDNLQSVLDDAKMSLIDLREQQGERGQ